MSPRMVLGLVFGSITFGAAMVGLALAAPADSNEQLGPEALTDYRASVSSPLDGADSLDWSSPLNAGPGTGRSLIATAGNPVAYVRVDHSVAGGTVAVYCGLWQKRGSSWAFLGISGVSTATATAPGGTPSSRASGRYVANELLAFDTGPATHVELRKSDPSDSGTVSLLPIMGSSAPRGAGSD